MATLTRADTLTETLKKREMYSDFMDEFMVSPINGELARVVNERAVKQSIYNLVMTNRGERPFQPLLGSDVLRSLFSPKSPILLSQLRKYIENVIHVYEKRANLLSVVINDDRFDANAIDVTITFTLLNSEVPVSMNLILKSVR